MHSHIMEVLDDHVLGVNPGADADFSAIERQ